MKYEKLRSYTEERFRRITGVKRKTYEKMLEILRVAEAVKRAKGGPKPKLTLEDQLLVTLEYLREYRTYAHIAVGYGLSESQIFRIVRWVEDTLIKDGTFSLPGRKELLKSDVVFEVILIDDTESPIERPKKGKKCTTPERKATYHENASGCEQG